MPCDREELRHVPLFKLLDDDEAGILAAQVEMRQFAPRQRIFKMGEAAQHGYVVMSGSVRLTTLDEDQQEVVVDEPEHGDFFGFASMLQETSHQTTAVAIDSAVCLEIGRDDLFNLMKHRPEAGMDMLTMQARQIHAAHKLVRSRTTRNPNEVIEERTTLGERIADSVARFGGSWAFIITFAVILAVYSSVNVALRGRAWDPYPFILLNLFLSMLAAVQAPVIMMSQNRQDAKDRLRSELDFEVNRRAEAEIQSLSHRLALMTDQLSDIEEVIRKNSAPRQPVTTPLEQESAGAALCDSSGDTAGR
jgi:CRP/FNR family transcriptional regulator, cyclic AMP receptor protein